MRSDLLCTWVTKAASLFVKKIRKKKTRIIIIIINILPLASSFLFFFSHTGRFYL